ncbi:hypothetical protein KFL_017000010, partial [Klebsormidium nitens]
MKRYEEHFQERLPRFFWTDNTRSDAANLYCVLSSLEQVLEDATHCMARYFDAIPDSHPLKGDKGTLRNHLLQHARKKLTLKEINAKPNSCWNIHCRRTIPSKEVLATRMDAVMRKYELGGNGNNGDRTLVTLELQKVHENQLKLVRAGALSDPLGVEDMYYDVSKPGSMPQFKSIRGTSKLEGYHKHLNSLFSGGNCSPELADALLTIFNYRWNITCGITNRGDPDFRMNDHFLLEEMQAVCRQMGWPDPFPEWKKAPPTKERFGADNLPPEVREALEMAAALEEPGATERDREAVALEEILERQALAKQARDAEGPVSPPSDQTRAPPLSTSKQSRAVPAPRSEQSPEMFALPSDLPCAQLAPPSDQTRASR